MVTHRAAGDIVYGGDAGPGGFAVDMDGAGAAQRHAAAVFVPMSPSSSRRYQSSGVDGSPSNDCSWPLTRNLTMRVSPRVKLIAVILFPQAGGRNIVNRPTTQRNARGGLGKI